LFGHTLAFGPDTGRAIGHGGWIGGLDYLGFRAVGTTPHPIAPTIPHTAFAVFELLLAVVVVAIVAGASAGRVKFSAFIVFAAAWILIVYAPIVHWMWGSGLLGSRGLGALDFAGGTVVHQSAGVAVFALLLVLGRRNDTTSTHDVPSELVGSAILWLGWFGLVGGSAFASGGHAAVAVLNVQLAGAAGMLGWLIGEWTSEGTPTPVGAARGAISGLVAITPAAGFVRPGAALVVGFAGGFICCYVVRSRRMVGDEVFAVHYMGGLVGMVLTGVFAAKSGLVYSSAFAQLGKQVVASGVVTVWSFALSYVILKVVDWTIGLRVAVDGTDFVGGKA